MKQLEDKSDFFQNVTRAEIRGPLVSFRVGDKDLEPLSTGTDLCEWAKDNLGPKVTIVDARDNSFHELLKTQAPQNSFRSDFPSM